MVPNSPFEVPVIAMINSYSPAVNRPGRPALAEGWSLCNLI
jgi:hypothetical protein